MSNTVQNIILGIATLALVSLGVFLFFVSDDTSLNATGTTSLDSKVLLNAQLFLSRKAVLDNLELDKGLALFSDEKFVSLESNAVPLASQRVGKETLFEEATESSVTTTNEDSAAEDTEDSE